VTERRIRQVFLATCWLPPVLLGGLLRYVQHFEGWGQWAAAPVLLLPVVVSIPITATGVALILGARRPWPVTVVVVAATVFAAVPLLWLAYRAFTTT
jgi:hypothetical protein